MNKVSLLVSFGLFGLTRVHSWTRNRHVLPAPIAGGTGHGVRANFVMTRSRSMTIAPAAVHANGQATRRASRSHREQRFRQGPPKRLGEGVLNAPDRDRRAAHSLCQ